MKSTPGREHPPRPPATGPTLYLNKDVRHRILQGHSWVFKSEIDHVENDPQSGQTVEVRNLRGNFLGSGIYNDKSQIVFRRYSRKSEPLDEAFIDRALNKALDYRKRLHAEPPAAQRLFWSESDGLPGLIVDRYGSVIVIQTLTLAMSRLEPIIANLLQKKLTPSAIIARNDAPIRRLEGLPLEKKVLHGKYEPPTALRLLGFDWELDLLSGQKTGFYLDQMDTYAKVARHARGRTVLDCFCNQGAFALTAMAAGATACRAIDQSEEAVQIGAATAARHGLKIEWKAGNVFDILPAYEKERQTWDMIILDPPSFTKSKGKVDAARRGYIELHMRAVRLLAQGGLLASFCCSHHVGETEWRDLLREVAVESGVSLRLVDRFSQAADHPIINEIPESEYLRGYLLEKL